MITVTLQHSANGVFIGRGVYNSNDPALHGLAEYLLAAGHATGSLDETGPPVETVEDTPDLDSMTKAELVEYAESHNIDLEDARLKDDILARLKGE